MSKEINHGNYQEFVRTPQETRILKDRKKLESLEKRYNLLESKVEELEACIAKLINKD